MEKITKEPSFAITVIVILLVFIGLFVLRISLQKREPKPEHEYEYGSIVSEKSGLMNFETFIKLGNEALADNRFEDAKTIFEFGIAHFPNSPELWLGLSETYINQGQKKEAAANLKKAAELMPDNAHLWYRLSQLYYLTNDFASSYEAIQKAVQLEPENLTYQKSLAEIATLNRDYQTASQAYEKILEKQPNNPEILFAYHKTKSWAKEKKPVNHEEIFLKRIKDDLAEKRDDRISESLNEYRLLFGETPAYQLLLAEHVYRKYLITDPRNAQTWYELANFYFTFNRPKPALETIEEALRLKPNNLEFLSLKAKIANQLDKIDMQIETYEKMLAINPNQPKLKAELAVILLSRKAYISSQIIESNHFLLGMAIALLDCDFVSAIRNLDLYAEKEGKNPIYQSMITFLARILDKCTIASICPDNILIDITKKMIEVEESLQDNSYVVKTTAENIAQQAVCRDPCSLERLDLLAQTERLLEDPILAELVKAQRLYSDMLCIDPCNAYALRNLARVTALYGEIDGASCLYESYFRLVGIECADPKALIEYANVLESQGRNYLALKFLWNYASLCPADRSFYETLAHQLNSADRPSPAFVISDNLLHENNCNYSAWLNYTRAAALLSYPYASLYGLSQIETLEPTNPLTTEAKWLTLIPLMSNLNAAGTFHQEHTTGLTFWQESLFQAFTLCPGTQFTAGASGFETHAALENVVILGLGDLKQRNGESWAGEIFGWVGFNKIFNRFFQGNFRFGVGYTDADSNLVTPAYETDLFFPIYDNLDINLNSSYGFYLYSPKALSLFIRDWRQELVIDWWPSLEDELLSTWVFDWLTDGNQRLEITVYPRHTFCNSLHWKWVIGLMGNWLMARKEVEHGYYSPHLYQAYAVEGLLDYIINDFSVIKLNGTIGMQKDTFSDRFGFLGEAQLQVLYNLSLNWYVEFFVDYFYLDSSTGYFDSIEIQGQLTHRY